MMFLGHCLENDPDIRQMAQDCFKQKTAAFSLLFAYCAIQRRNQALLHERLKKKYISFTKEEKNWQ